MELGNVALSGSVFVQFLPEARFSLRAFVLGVLTFGILYGASLYLSGGGGRV